MRRSSLRRRKFSNFKKRDNEQVQGSPENRSRILRGGKGSPRNLSDKTARQKSNSIRSVHSEPIDRLYCTCDHDVIKKPYRRIQIHNRTGKESSRCGQKVSDGNFTADSKSCTSDGLRPFKCEEDGCESAFKTAHDRYSHIWNVHRERIECPFPQCRVMIKPKSLLRHIRVLHQKLREECYQCGKYVRYGDMIAHYKNCTNDGSPLFLQCFEDGCESMFEFSQERTAHLLIHHHREKFECPLPDCHAMIHKYKLPEHVAQVHSTAKPTSKRTTNKISPGRYQNSKADYFGRRNLRNSPRCVLKKRAPSFTSLSQYTEEESIKEPRKNLGKRWRKLSSGSSVSSQCFSSKLKKFTNEFPEKGANTRQSFSSIKKSKPQEFENQNLSDVNVKSAAKVIPKGLIYEDSDISDVSSEEDCTFYFNEADFDNIETALAKIQYNLENLC